MSDFELIFRGELAEGVDQQDCIEALAVRLKTEPDTIRTRFFQHWPVTVLATDNEAKAKRVQQVFEEAGAIVTLQSVAQTSAPSMTSSSEKPASKRGLWIVASVLLLAGVGAFAGWYTQPLWQTHQHPLLQRAEAALASDDLLLLAHLDVKKLTDIEQRFMTVTDPEALPSSGTDLLSDLARVGIDPKKQLDTALLAGYQADQALEFAAVLLGQFDPEKVKALVKQRYDLDPSQSQANRLVFDYTDEMTCERSAPMVILIETDRLLISTQSRMDGLATRFGQSSTAAIDLAAWQTYRADKLASATVFAPTAVTESSRGLSGMMMRGASQALGPLTAAYLGASATAMPPGIRFEATVSGTDAQALDSQADALRNQLQELTDTLAYHEPETVKLLKRVAVVRSQDQLGASLVLDGNAGEELMSLGQAVMGQMFSISSSVAGEENTARQEQLEDNPARFFLQFDPANLAAFDDIPDDHFHAAWKQGPLALRIKEIGVDPKNDNRSYLLLNGQGRSLTNVAKEQGGSLVVSGIYDQSGNAIMPAPSCGQNRNQDPAMLSKTMDGSYYADGEFQHYGKHEVDKKVLLAPGTSLDAVARVEGEMTLQVATRTEARVVQMPVTGASVQLAGARVAFGNSEGQSLSYVTSGDVSRILAVRALNKDGKPLASQSHSSFGPVLGTGKAHQYDYHGTPVSVEVVIATELKPLRYPFVIENIQPWQDTDFSAQALRLPEITDRRAVDEALQQPLPADAAQYDNYGNPPKGTVVAGPVQLALTSVQAGGFQGLYSQWDVRTVKLAALEGNRVAGNILLQEIIDSNGVSHEVEASGGFGLKQEGMFFNDEFRPSHAYLTGSAVASTREYEGAQPTELSGQVELQIPEKIVTLHGPLALGEEWTQGPVSLTAQALSENSLQLNVATGIGQLVAVELFDADGQPVGNQLQVWGSEQNNVRAQVSLSGVPASMTLHVIEESRTVQYPWRLSLEENTDQ